MPTRWRAAAWPGGACFGRSATATRSPPTGSTAARLADPRVRPALPARHRRLPDHRRLRRGIGVATPVLAGHVINAITGAVRAGRLSCGSP